MKVVAAFYIDEVDCSAYMWLQPEDATTNTPADCQVYWRGDMSLSFWVVRWSVHWDHFPRFGRGQRWSSSFKLPTFIKRDDCSAGSSHSGRTWSYPTTISILYLRLVNYSLHDHQILRISGRCRNLPRNLLPSMIKRWQSFSCSSIWHQSALSEPHGSFLFSFGCDVYNIQILSRALLLISFYVKHSDSWFAFYSGYHCARPSR